MTDTRIPSMPLEELLVDPPGTLARMRAQTWIADAGLAQAVLRNEDVRAMFNDERLRADFPDFLRSVGVSGGPFFEWMSLSPLNHDGDEHRAWRSVVSRAFTPRGVDPIRPFLRASSNQLIDNFAASRECEFVSAFADALPSFGLCELIGVPPDDRDRFRAWANAIGLGFNVMAVGPRIAEIDAALIELLAYARALAAQRRAAPRDDLISRIAQAGEQHGWTDEMVAGTIAGLVFAGHETTKNQLGWMIAVLAEQPRVWNAVAEGTLEVRPVVEEMLRHRSTVTGVGRSVSESIEHKGVTLPAGTRLLLSLWSADHDDAVWPAAMTFDPNRRDPQPHLAFGLGAHHCLGAALARAELEESLAALTGRLGCPTIGEGAEWTAPAGITGPLRLPVRFAPAQRPASA